MDKVIRIDQSRLTYARSNPATYTGVFTQIAEHLRHAAGIRERGYKADDFLQCFGGRCEACQAKASAVSNEFPARRLRVVRSLQRDGLQR